MSTHPTVYGVNGMTLTGTKKGYSKNEGETTIETWAGPLDKALVMYESLKTDPSVSNLSIDPDAPVCKLEVTRPDPENQTTELANAIWEVEPFDVLKDLRSHPYFQYSAFDLSDLARCDKAIENGTNVDFDGCAVPTIVKRYWGLRMSGVQSYYQHGLTIRKTIQVSGTSTITLAYENINKIVDISTINPPSQLLGTLRTMQYLYFTGSGPLVDRHYGTAPWQWLERGARCRSVGRNKFQLVYEWMGLEAWSRVFYGGSFDPMAP